MATSRGLGRARGIYHNRTVRIRELKSQGAKIIGYMDTHPPVEIITAFFNEAQFRSRVDAFVETMDHYKRIRQREGLPVAHPI